MRSTNLRRAKLDEDYFFWKKIFFSARVRGGACVKNINFPEKEPKHVLFNQKEFLASWVSESVSDSVYILLAFSHRARRKQRLFRHRNSLWRPLNTTRYINGAPIPCYSCQKTRWVWQFPRICHVPHSYPSTAVTQHNTTQSGQEQSVTYLVDISLPPAARPQHTIVYIQMWIVPTPGTFISYYSTDTAVAWRVLARARSTIITNL